MKVCQSCGKEFPSTQVIDGIRRYFSGRKHCLECSPLGSKITRPLKNGQPANRKFTEEQFREAVANSYSVASTIAYLGLDVGGANYRMFYKLAKELNVSYDHFTGQGYLKDKSHNWGTKRYTTEEIMTEDSPYRGGSSTLKKRLLNEGIFDYKCDTCGISEWCNQPLSLHLDHINGNDTDNRKENLRLLCPNCHSQTSTYAGKNKGKRPDRLSRRRESNSEGVDPSELESDAFANFATPRIKEKDNLKCLVCQDDFIPKNKGQKYCSWDCLHKSQRKVDRPTREQLQEEMENLSWCAMARKYGVSDTAVRKWAKGYGLLE